MPHMQLSVKRSSESKTNFFLQNYSDGKKIGQREGMVQISKNYWYIRTSKTDGN